MRILFCGLSGYPNNNKASINRYVSIAKAMAYKNNIIFVNRIPLIEKGQNLSNNFRIEDATGFKYRSNNFFFRNFLKLISPILEIFKIRNLNNEEKIDWLNVYTQYFGLCLFYSVLSKIFKFKTILHYVEFRSEFENRSIFLKFNDFLFDKYSTFLFDRYIPISNFLNEHLKEKNLKAKTLIIPPICDFDYFKKLKCNMKLNEKYFLYCGGSGYSEVIIFIIKAFEKQQVNKSVKLYLVLSGQVPNHINKLIENSDGRIKLFSNLDYDKLLCFYKNAIALLAPLRNTEQDRARFPQKICEYLASNKVLISTNIGEVKFFFKDMSNALIAANYNLESFTRKMEWVLRNINNLKLLEENSYNNGKKYFNIKSYENSIKAFLE